MMPWVSGLAAGFPLALVLAAARSLLSGQTIGGRGLGRVCGVPLAQGELSFQVGDLERQLALRKRNSTNSSKPPSSDGLEEFVEFLLRRASCRSKSVICFS